MGWIRLVMDLQDGWGSVGRPAPEPVRQQLARHLAVLPDRVGAGDRVLPAPGDDARPARPGRRRPARGDLSARSPAGRRPDGRPAGRTPGAVPVLCVPGDLSHRRPVRRHARARGASGRSGATPCSSSRRSCWPSRSSPTRSCTRATAAGSGSCWAGARRGSRTARSPCSSSTPPTWASRSRSRSSRRSGRATCPRRWFIVAWMVVLFIVPNVVVVSAVEFDMNKYFQIMWIAGRDPRGLAHPRLAEPVDRRRRSRSRAISPVLIAYWHLTNPAVVMTAAQERAGALDRDATPETLGVRHRRQHQQPGRHRRSAAHHDVRAVRLEPGLRPGAARDGHDGASTATGRTWPPNSWTSTARRTCCRAAGSSTATTASRRTSPSSDRFETVYDVDGVSVWRLRAASQRLSPWARR